MGRKPYQKYQLTDEEYNIVNRIADSLKLGWFSIAGTWADGEGRHQYMRCKRFGYDSGSSKFDICYDLEMRHYTSLQFGLTALNDAFEADEPLNTSRLTKEEISIYKNLLKKLNIVH